MREYASRLLSRLQSTEKYNGIDALFITDPYNMRYLSGFGGGEGALLITHEDCVLITDSRYTEAAASESDFTVAEESRSRRRTQILREYAEQCGFSCIGFEDLHLTCAAFEKLRADMPDRIVWMPIKDAADQLRRVKLPWEIERIAKAEAIGDQAFAALCRVLKTGMTELEAAAELEYQMKLSGAEGLSFDTIAASGPHSSMPHAVPTTRVLQAGDFLTLDFGCRFAGYCSDMTRTVAFGPVSKKQREIYETVLRAQQAGIRAVCAGTTGEAADEAARAVIREAGYGKYFGHALGHSVGLYIHEEPRLGPGAQTVLEPGMAVTVEPGIYVPGVCGVRIEDLVVVTEQGCSNLTASPKELLIFS